MFTISPARIRIEPASQLGYSFIIIITIHDADGVSKISITQKLINSWHNEDVIIDIITEYNITQFAAASRQYIIHDGKITTNGRTRKWRHQTDQQIYKTSR